MSDGGEVVHSGETEASGELDPQHQLAIEQLFGALEALDIPERKTVPLVSPDDPLYRVRVEHSNDFTAKRDSRHAPYQEFTRYYLTERHPESGRYVTYSVTRNHPEERWEGRVVTADGSHLELGPMNFEALNRLRNVAENGAWRLHQRVPMVLGYYVGKAVASRRERAENAAREQQAAWRNATEPISPEAEVILERGRQQLAQTLVGLEPFRPGEVLKTLQLTDPSTDRSQEQIHVAPTHPHHWDLPVPLPPPEPGEERHVRYQIRHESGRRVRNARHYGVLVHSVTEPTGPRVLEVTAHEFQLQPQWNDAPKITDSRPMGLEEVDLISRLISTGTEEQADQVLPGSTSS